MILSTSHYPPLPTSDPITTTSFHAYPVSSRSSLHTVLLQTTPHPRSLRGPAYPPTQDASRSSSRCPIAGPGPTCLSLRHERKALKRAEKRAVAGQRPAGVGMAIDADDLSEEEEMLREERQRTDMFGHRFLLPIGQRQTQMEKEQAPSPTPSDAGEERRQEDRGMASPSMHAPIPMEGDEPGGELDLDASVEDLDGDMEDLDDEMDDEDELEGEEDEYEDDDEEEE